MSEHFGASDARSRRGDHVMPRSIGHQLFNPLEAELAVLRKRVSRLEEQVESLRRELEAAGLHRS
ncbi:MULTISPECIES: hypothetical protein [Nonomuraea]|uniref:DUF1192 domain-containing protein n=1 Tax=Nonomuraea mangrovi TaxID=2316207 RepID=A0ABW4SLR4_9ACTN